MPSPDSAGGVDPAPQPDSTRHCASCQRSHWEGFLLACPEDARLHEPLEPACDRWRDMEHKAWG